MSIPLFIEDTYITYRSNDNITTYFKWEGL